MRSYLRQGTDATPFCPGCGHGILMGAVLRAIDRLKLDPRQLLFVSGIGCGGWIPSPHFAADTLHTLHGRAIPFATGAKVANPGLTTLVISGDGDLAAIGGNHLIHGARRNVDLTVICANNQTFGMTGGQPSPTTPTSDRFENLDENERSFDLLELVVAAGAVYAARFPVTRPVALSRAVEHAIEHRGFSFVEAVTPCPTHQLQRSGAADLNDLYDRLEQRCRTAEELEEMPDEAAGDYLLVGEFIH